MHISKTVIQQFKIQNNKTCYAEWYSASFEKYSDKNLQNWTKHWLQQVKSEQNALSKRPNNFRNLHASRPFISP